MRPWNSCSRSWALPLWPGWSHSLSTICSRMQSTFATAHQRTTWNICWKTSKKAIPSYGKTGRFSALWADRLRPLILCGHTHLPRVVALSSGQLVVNPGSVGLPAYADDAPVAHAMQTFSPHASYAILESGPSGWDRAAAESSLRL